MDRDCPILEGSIWNVCTTFDVTLDATAIGSDRRRQESGAFFVRVDDRLHIERRLTQILSFTD